MHLACREAVKLVTEYLEDALDAPTRAAFVEHIDQCEDCEEFLRQVRWTIKALGQAGPAV